MTIDHPYKPILFTALAALLCSCGGGSRELEPLDIQIEGTNLRINAPAGATSAASGPGTEVTAEDFEVLVRPGTIDLEDARSRAESNENQEVIHSDANGLIVGQQFLGQTIYSVKANTTVNGTAYRCQTDPLSAFNDESDARAMLSACQSLAAR